MAQLPLEFHALTLALKALYVSKRNDSAHDIVTPPDELEAFSPDEAEHARWVAYLDHAFLVVANRNTHGNFRKRHCASCTIGKRGKTGCRFCAGWGHGFPETRCIQLHPYKSAQDVEAHPQPDGSIDPDTLPAMLCGWSIGKG